jgi:methanol metabolism-related c-type cytochrome
MGGNVLNKLIFSAALFGCATLASAQDKKVEDGKYFNKDDVPTYNIQADGTVDWYTYSGFRRYHSDCHVCHGPDGLGSTYAPGLVDSVKRLSYEDFQSIIANGRQVTGAAGASVMPAFGTNPNVMCYLDDIWVYLKARAEGGLERNRPPKREDQPAANKEYEKSCMGG